MSTQTTGIILKKQIINEADILVTIFSRELGKIKCIGQKAKKRAEIFSKLEVLTENVFLLSKPENMSKIYEIDQKNIFKNIRQDYQLFKTAAEFVKIINKATVPAQANPLLYEHLVKYLELLNNRQDLNNIRECFLVNLLKIEGLLTNKKTFSKQEINQAFYNYTGAYLGNRQGKI